MIILDLTLSLKITKMVFPSESRVKIALAPKHPLVDALYWHMTFASCQIPDIILTAFIIIVTVIVSASTLIPAASIMLASMVSVM